MISHASLDETLPSTSLGTELNLKGCNVCGQNHSTETCPFLGNLLPVQDTKTTTKARLTLPANLEVQTLADGSPTVIARATFERGTQFGPFQARRSDDLQLSIEFPLKIFNKDSEESYYLDTSDEEFCNWMCLVAPATLAKEQNLMCYQMKQDIYYTVMKRINPGEQLKVWYAPYYALKMGVVQPTKKKVNALTDHVYGSQRKEKKVVQNMLLNREVTEKIVEKLAPQQLGAKREDVSKWKCRLCGEEQGNSGADEAMKGGGGVAAFAKHLMTHYRPRHGRNSAQKTWPCHLCLQKFEGEKELLHHKVKEHNVAIRRPRLLGSQEKQDSPSTDSSKIDEDRGLAEQEEFNWQEDEGKTTSIVIAKIPETKATLIKENGNGCLTISSFDSVVKAESVVNPNGVVNADSVSENVTESMAKAENVGNADSTVNADNVVNGLELGPPYICDICCKEFHRAEYMYRHLRKHTGEFTCVSCLAVFARKESLQTHVCVGGVAPNRYACSYCPKMFTVQKLLNRHIAKHKGEFMCQLCKRVYSSKGSLDAHHCTKDEADINSAGDPKAKIIKCSICSKGFVNQNYLQRHLVHHHPNDEPVGYNCQFCEKSFDLNEALTEHQSFCEQAKQLDAGSKGICPICKTEFHEIALYRSHVLDHTHPFLCQHCGSRFRTRKSSSNHTCNLQNHLNCEVCHQDFATLPILNHHLGQHGTASFHCFECGRSFYQSDNFEKHECGSSGIREEFKGKKRKGRSLRFGSKETDGVSVTGTNTSLVCEVCGVQYKTVYSLRAHVQLHGERRFQCDICSKRFHRKDVLQEHISVHQDAQIPCPVCEKKVKTKKSLEVHMLLHSGDRRYKCDECGKEFYQKGNLQKHLAVHEPISKKAHPCPHCGKMFMSRDYLGVHLLEHTQGKVHQCTLCNKAFVKEHLLRTHHKYYHNNQLYACRYCGQSMRLRQSLRRHLVSRHSEHQNEWNGVGALDAMLTSLGDSTGATINVAGVQTSSSSSLAIHSRTNFVDVAESAEILLTVAAGLHTMDGVEQVESVVNHDGNEENSEAVGQMEPLVIGSGEGSVCTAVDQGGVVVNDADLSCLAGISAGAEVITEVSSDGTPIQGHTFILEDGTIIQQDGNNTGDILLCVLGSEIQAADLNLE